MEDGKCWAKLVSAKSQGEGLGYKQRIDAIHHSDTEMSMQGACILSGVLGVRSWAPIMVCATKKHKWIITDSVSVNKHEPGNMLFHMHQFNYSPKQHNEVDIIIPPF